MRPPSEAERRRLAELFADLCRIVSPSGSEEVIAADVRGRLERMRAEVRSDAAGNLLARIPGRTERSILLCAHLDTVAVQGAVVEPVEVDGGWENARDAILGADNKAALAVMLATAQRAADESAPVGLELLFTVREEDALAGAKEFDASALRSDWGYVFDHASPIGGVVTASPTYYRLEASFRGAAAHAGIRPEDGRSAILAASRAIGSLRLGRIDARTTANVASIRGGVGGTNVVPEHCSFLAECRSLDSGAADALAAEMVERCQDAGNDPPCDVDVDVSLARLFEGYEHRPNAPAVLAAEAALYECGYEPTRLVTGGASDANALEAQGFSCTNLANGTERNHEPTERVATAALQGMLDVSFALLEACAAPPEAG